MLIYGMIGCRSESLEGWCCMSEQELMTVKQVADAVGVSAQAIYKRLRKVDNQIKPFVVEVDNQKMLRKSILSEVYGIEDSKPVVEPVNPVVQPEKTPESTALNRMIDLLEKELAEKDKQIEAKQKEIDKLLSLLEEEKKTSARLLENEQKLMLIEKQEKQQPEQTEEAEAEVKEVVAPPPPEEPQEETKQQSRFKMWLKKFLNE